MNSSRRKKKPELPLRRRSRRKESVFGSEASLLIFPNLMAQPFQLQTLAKDSFVFVVLVCLGFVNDGHKP